MTPTWLIVPVKPFAEGKSRLTTKLSPVQRARLSRQLLTHVIKTAAASELFAHMLVVSRDPSVAEIAKRFAVELLAEEGRDLNDALQQARERAVAHGAEAILVLPSDLPRLTVDDLEQLVAASDAGAVLAPSRDHGTNALLLEPPGLIDFAFGPGSFDRHRHLAQQAGVTPRLIATPSLAFDLDSPDDLAELAGDGAAVCVG